MISESNRQHHIDKRFDSDEIESNLSNNYFLRVSAKEKKFKKVDFKYSFFDDGYFRKCVFDSCDFTGCRFSSVNFESSSFIGCKFDYATFEKTNIDSTILDNNCPSYENLKLKFARSLRVNFSQIGDPQAVNKAIKVELDATEIHLRKSWNSNDVYYRSKYTGLHRARMFAEWLKFKLSDFGWGNGENLFKLLRTTAIIIVLMMFYDVLFYKDNSIINSYWQSLLEIPSIFLGATSPEYYPTLYLGLIVFIRLVTLGLFVAIMVKRLNRR